MLLSLNAHLKNPSDSSYHIGPPTKLSNLPLQKKNKCSICSDSPSSSFERWPFLCSHFFNTQVPHHTQAYVPTLVQSGHWCHLLRNLQKPRFFSGQFSGWDDDVSAYALIESESVRLVCWSSTDFRANKIQKHKTSQRKLCQQFAPSSHSKVHLPRYQPYLGQW